MLGVARLGALCSKYSACVTQDFGYSQAIVGTVAAHELGHLFGMQHDNGSRPDLILDKWWSICVFRTL